jgi:putative hemolysin
LLQRLGKMQTREELKKQGLRLFPRLLHYLAKGNEWDMLLFSMHFGKLLFYVLFAATFSSSLRAVFSKQEIVYSEMLSPLLLSVLAALFFDFFMQLCCVKNPKFWLKFLSGPSSAILTLTAPITIPLSALAVRFFSKKTELKLPSSYRIHDKLLEWIKDSDVDSLLEKNEKKLIYAVFSFKDRIAREVMVPRIRVFSLSSDSTIFEASESFLNEGYSRIPVYRENVDSIVGVLLYKDDLLMS